MKIKKIQERSLDFGDNPIANEDGSFDVTFSSEKPGERPYGIEIVKHDPGCVDLSYAKKGLNLLDNHDINMRIGRATNIHIDPETKTGKCQIRFFSTAHAQEVKQQVLEGLDTISYRYSIDKFDVVKSATPDGLPTVYVTKSTPKEISVVSVPFDYDKVGINRSEDEDLEIDFDQLKAEETETVVIQEQPLEQKIEVTEVITEETKSVVITEIITHTDKGLTTMNAAERAALLTLSAFAIKSDCGQEFAELSATDKGLDEIKSSLMDIIAAKNSPVSTSNRGVTEDDVKSLQKDFSFARAFEAKTTGDWKKAGFEADVQRQWADKQVNYDGKSLIIPLEAFKAGNANTMAITGAGSNFLFTEYGGFLEMLRPQSVLIANGADVMPGLTQNLKMIVESAQPATYWIAENSGTDVPVGAFGTATKTLSPHQLMCQGQFTRQFLIQQPLQFESKIQQILLRELALAMDLAGFGNYITGGVLTPLSGAPSQGILLDGSVPVVSIGTNGGNISANAAKVLALETTLNLNNALLGFNPIYMTTPGVQGILKSTVPPGLTYASAPYWHDNTLGGYKAIGSNQLPSTLNKGTANGTCNTVIMGDPKNLTFGLFGDLMVDLDDKTLLGQGAYRLIANQMLDVVCTRPTGFAVINDAIAL